ncbi:MAG: hypothetical protein P8X74_23515, partial [Reinekea sp.]
CSKVQAIWEFSAYADQKICADPPNPQLYELDKLVRIQYHTLLETSAEENKLKKDQGEWEETVRSRCDNERCLVEVYQERLRALGGTPPEKVTFSLSYYSHRPICEAYLEVLNRTPLNELKPCAIPDLTGSPIQSIKFKPLAGDVLKATDRLVYEHSGGGPHDDWEQQWPQRKKEYAMGYRYLGETWWDLDGDGNKDRIIDLAEPGQSCSLNFMASEEDKKAWQQLSMSEKMSEVERVGYFHAYKVISGDTLNRIHANNLISYEGKIFSLYQRDVMGILHLKKTDLRERVFIYGIRSTLDMKLNEYKTTSAKCKFWLNY